MPRKLPLDAFEHYVALGDKRSYRAVADHYGVSKQTVVARAVKEDWQGQLERIEAEVRRHMERRAVELLVRIREREIEQARLVREYALLARRSQPRRKRPVEGRRPDSRGQEHG